MERKLVIRVYCKKCKKELDSTGALIFSPPHNLHNIVSKYHICRDCFEKLTLWFSEPIREEFCEPDKDDLNGPLDGSNKDNL